MLIRIKAKTATLKEKLKFKEFEVDIQTNEVFYKDEPLYLGDVQKNLFISLIKNYPNPVVKDELLELLEKSSDIALRVNMNKLKKHIGIDIQNVRGVGYKII